MRFLIIGGSDAGISAALRVRELRPSWEITLILADAFPNYSICGLPFYLSGETPDWHSLAHRTEFPGIEILARHTAEAIDVTHKRVEVRRADRSGSTLGYDKLLIATGARPVQPAIQGLDLTGVFLLHTMEDSFAMHRYLQERQPRSAVIGSRQAGQSRRKREYLSRVLRLVSSIRVYGCFTERRRSGRGR